MTIQRSVSALLVFLSFLCLLVVPAHAQLPLPSNMGGGIIDGVKGKIIQKLKDALTKPIAEAVGVNAPIKLDQSTAFPKTLDVQDFRPHFWMPTSGADLARHLPPGDYAIPVTAYCTDYSIHVPGRGAPYKLAPLEGREANILTTILVRGTIQKVPHDTLQEINWRLQAGIPLNQWPEEEQATVHQLAPEDENALQGDLLQKAESAYQQVSKNANRFPFNLAHASVPSFDDLISGMGAAGVQVRKIEAARKVLADQTATAERIPDLLYEKTGDGSPRILPPEEHPEASPWSQVRPGLLARFIVFDGRMGQNLYEFRITKEAQSTQTVAQNDTANFIYASYAKPLDFAGSPAATNLAEWPTLAEALGIEVTVGEAAAGGLAIPVVGEVELAAGALYIAYSLGEGRQALIPFPDFTWTNITLSVSNVKQFAIRNIKTWDEAKDEPSQSLYHYTSQRNALEIEKTQTIIASEPYGKTKASGAYATEISPMSPGMTQKDLSRLFYGDNPKRDMSWFVEIDNGDSDMGGFRPLSFQGVPHEWVKDSPAGLSVPVKVLSVGPNPMPPGP